MLKKGQPIAFKRDDTLMKRVFEAIQAGESTITRIALVTRLPHVQVRRSVHYLSYTGNIKAVRIKWRFCRYYVPEAVPTESEAMSIGDVMKLFNKAGRDEE